MSVPPPPPGATPDCGAVLLAFALSPSVLRTSSPRGGVAKTRGGGEEQESDVGVHVASVVLDSRERATTPRGASSSISSFISSSSSWSDADAGRSNASPQRDSRSRIAASIIPADAAPRNACANEVSGSGSGWRAIGRSGAEAPSSAKPGESIEHGAGSVTSGSGMISAGGVDGVAKSGTGFGRTAAGATLRLGGIPSSRTAAGAALGMGGGTGGTTVRRTA
mmetsp:Transcript_37612/g.88982  ORF Transcript_37612/g.88982 Transcript_37612/m.88982 type:complete len:222 (+) Transcript_37612:1406-2071(+)